MVAVCGELKFVVRALQRKANLHVRLYVCVYMCVYVFTCACVCMS